MKEIQLTQGKVALVDDADYDWINQWKWYAHKSKGRTSFYARRNVYIDGKHLAVKMHRQILGLTDPKIFVDHADGDGLNNQRNNIRCCTAIENGRNRSQHKGTTSRYRGVSFKAKNKKWIAQIKPHNKPVHVGCFSDEKDAALAYNEAAKKYYGEFARLNIITQ